MGKADKISGFPHIRSTQTGTFKSMQKIWGSRLVIESVPHADCKQLI